MCIKVLLLLLLILFVVFLLNRCEPINTNKKKENMDNTAQYNNSSSGINSFFVGNSDSNIPMPTTNYLVQNSSLELSNSSLEPIQGQYQALSFDNTVEGQPIQGQLINIRQQIQGQPIEGQPIQGQQIQGQPIEGQPIQGVLSNQSNSNFSNQSNSIFSNQSNSNFSNLSNSIFSNPSYQSNSNFSNQSNSII